MSNLELNPFEFTKAIATSPEYREARTRGKEKALAIHLASRALAHAVNRPETSISHGERDVFNVISKIDSFADAQWTLDEYRDTAHGREMLPYKRQVTEFNHAVKELVNNNPKLGFDQVVRFTTQMYIGAHQDEFAQMTRQEQKEYTEWFGSITSQSLSGMRHELGFEQILGYLERTHKALDYKEGDTESDRLGADYLVTLDGKYYFPVDVKASLRSVEASQRKSRNPSHIVWSHLYNDDFGNNFRVSDETVVERANDVYHDLIFAQRNVA